jgi:hypothetical protein
MCPGVSSFLALLTLSVAYRRLVAYWFLLNSHNNQGQRALCSDKKKMIGELWFLGLTLKTLVDFI